jgi:site-specific recombinase XerD
VLETAADPRLMPADECRAACNWKPVRGESIIAGRDVQPGEISALVRVGKEDKTPAGARDVAMIDIWYTCGVRRSELVVLDLADYEPATGELTIRRGKVDKARTVYSANGAQLALEVWLVTRGVESGPFFLPSTRAAG